MENKILNRRNKRKNENIHMMRVKENKQNNRMEDK